MKKKTRLRPRRTVSGPLEAGHVGDASVPINQALRWAALALESLGPDKPESAYYDNVRVKAWERVQKMLESNTTETYTEGVKASMQLLRFQAERMGKALEYMAAGAEAAAMIQCQQLEVGLLREQQAEQSAPKTVTEAIR